MNCNNSKPILKGAYQKSLKYLTSFLFVSPLAKEVIMKKQKATGTSYQLLFV